MSLFAILFLVLYCERQHGTGKELEDFSRFAAPRAPEWARKGVLYEVFPRVYTAQGNFRALQEKLPYIKELGIDIIWIMPIYPIGEKGRKGTLGSPFSIKDFRKINPEYGSEADFRALVEAIHRLGMKVIVGMVPNHSANDHVEMERHPDWFMRDEEGNFTREVADWSDVTDFNYDNPEMRRYMLETLLYWIEKFDVDGYRVDVAGMVPLDFWKEAIPRLRQIKPELYLLAEWEDPQLLIAGFNSDYDWTLYHLLKDIREGKKRSGEAVALIAEKDRRYPQNALPMRFLENHDEPRSLAVFGPQAIEAYATFIFTVPGIPLIYAGQEIGETEKPSLFEKTELNWAQADTALQNLYRRLIRWRKQYSCFTEGDFVPLQVAALKGSVGAFLREDDRYVAIVISNLWRKTAEKVFVTMPKEILNQLRFLEFQQLGRAEQRLNVEEMFFREIPPFQTSVFIAEKGSN